MKRQGNGKLRKRIVLIDDDSAVLASLEAGLGTHFDIVAICTSGGDALKKLSELPEDQRPHLVLLEISLKRGDGFQYCRELRRLFPGLVIALHTAHALPCFVNGARQVEADAYFRKPADIHMLAEELTHLHRTKCLLIDPTLLVGGMTGSLVLARDPHLSPRMKAVLELDAEGCGTKEIAFRLGMGVQTAYTQLHRGLDRLHSACSSDRTP